jgi:hypothetical protein
MGFHITETNRYGESNATFHYPDSEKDMVLHKVLGVGYIKDNTELKRTYSKGQLLEAKSKLLGISNTLLEVDFIDLCLLDVKDTNHNITITFN